MTGPSFAPPPVAAPASQAAPVPEAAGALAPVSGPTAATPASADFPLPPPSRSPQLLRRLQVVVALAGIVAGALATWVVADLRTQLDGAPALTQQYARLGEVRHDLNRAADLAARSVIAGEPATGQNARAANEELATATGLLSDAAAARPQDAAALNQLSQGVLLYAQAIAPAAGAGHTSAVAQLTTADTRLDGVLGGIDALQSSLKQEGAAQPVSQNTALVLWPMLALLGVVVWAAWGVAQLSHRVVNIGLAGTAVAIVLVLAIGLGAQGTALDASQASRGTQLTHVVNVSTAVAGLDQAQRVLTTAVLHRTWGSAQDTTYGSALRIATSAAASEKLPSLKTYDTAKVALTALMAKGDWAGAAQALAATDDKSLGSTAYTLLDRAKTKSDAAVAAAVSGPEGAQGLLVVQLVLAIIIALAGAVLGVLGLDRRLREYR